MRLPARNFQPSNPLPLAPADGAAPPAAPLSPVPPPPDADELYNYNNHQDDDHTEPNGSFAVPSALLGRLETFSLFKDAPKLFHTKVAAKLKLVQYHPQEFIIKEGDPALAMYWILKGTVSVTSTDGESVYAELNPGAVFGEIGILFNRPRTATVVARQKVLVGVLTADALNIVLRSYPLIERRIRDEAQERLAMQDKKNKADIPIVKLSKSPAPPVGGASFPPYPLLSVAPPSALVPLPLSQLVHAAQESSASAVHSLADNVDQTVSIQDFVKSVPIFSNLPSHIIHRLALGVEPINYKPFEYIFRKQDTGSDIYFITHGEVEVIDYMPPDGSEKILARLKNGSYFGEMSFLDLIQGDVTQTRSASIRSVTSVELIVIRSDLLETVCLQYPNVVAEIKRTANERKNSNQATPMGLAFSLNYSMLDFNTQRLPSRSVSPYHSRAPSPKSIEHVAPKPIVSHQPPLINPDWSFTKTDSSNSSSNPPDRSRSVSPVSTTDGDFSIQSKSTATSLFTVDDAANMRKRKSMCETTSPTLHLPEGPLDISVPPMNPIIPLRSFHTPISRRQSFQYMPHNKRVKLANLAGSRRSSVLVSTGSIPDKILLKTFEYLPLPELMRLRIISRRWRQLLYVAPNILHKLDLTPWNTSVDDQALISIADFVGSRPKHIDISNCFHVTDEGFSYLVNEIGMSGEIHVFKMRSLWEVSAMAIMDLTSPSVGRYLEEVDLSNCRKVKDNVVERLIGWSNGSERKSLLLPGSEGVFNNDAGSKNLKILNLGYCKHLTDNIMYHISLHANERLESLDLTRCTTITDAGFQYWTYRSFPNLKKLALKDCTFLSDKAIISLANAAPNLEILDLNFCCALLDIAIEVLCLGCQKLRELDLSFCGSAVSDSSLVAISLHLNNLEKLVVKGCVRVTRAGVDALLSGYSPLNYINISQCRNAHTYPLGVPAQKFQVNPATKSAFISAGPAQKIIEIVI